MGFFGRRARERELERVQREWRRQLEEDLRRLETAPGHEEVEPVGRDSQRYYPLQGHTPAAYGAPKQRTLNDRSRSYLAGLLALLVTVVVLLFDGGTGGNAFRGVLGIDDRIIDAVTPGGEGSYEFFETRQGSDKPVTWSPCEPIRYVINSAQAPDDWANLVKDSAAAVSEASGLSLSYQGTTTDRNFSNRDPGPNQVLIGWATAEEVPRLEGNVAGLGGPVKRTINGRSKYVAGTIVLDADAFDSLESAPAGRRQQQAIVMHEFGHLLGLDHVDDSSELMYAENVGRSDFGPGDLRGLALLGSGSCA